jgi:dienelactone hydrolase
MVRKGLLKWSNLSILTEKGDNKMKRSLLIISIILVLLLMPVILKDKGQPALVGPDLSELEYSEVFFENRYEGFQLAGMLFLPEGDGPFPAAIIIHGSGTSRRNSVWYLSVAKHLQDNGIAVLLPDKRGSEKSEGEWVGASFEELATDTLSAIEFVKDQQMFEYSTIGLVGMSQGGWIAPIVANQTDDVSFVVSMVGGAVTTDEQLLHEETNSIAPYTYTFIAKLIAPITTNKLKQLDHVFAFMGFDPIPYWKEVQVPVFFAFGGNDENVPVDASIERLRENNLRFDVKTYADGGHAIRDIQTNEVSDEYLQDLVRFIKEGS